MLTELFHIVPASVPIVLFDSGTLELHATRATHVVVAPSIVGIHTPEFDATPEYYLRGHYPLWFRLEKEIAPLSIQSLDIVGRPTTDQDADHLPTGEAREKMSLEALRDDRPTLWLAQPFA